MKVEIINGDITTMKVDAIVNAANRSLLGGGGVDGAIHRKAGKKLLEECKALGGCEIGEAKITKAYKLPCKSIIHTVAPEWYCEYEQPKEELLRNCYLNSLKLAEENGVKTIAFPCIGMGIYSCPKEIGTKIAIKTVLNFLESSTIEKVFFVCFEEKIYDYYMNFLEEEIEK